MNTPPSSTPSPKLRLSTFRCSELPVAAYCLLRGVELLRVEPGHPFSVFVFSPEGASISQEYFNGAQASCQEFAGAMQSAKRHLFAGRERSRGELR